MVKEWSKLSWKCGCGALNAGWLDKCGKCNKINKKLCVQVEIYMSAKKNGKTIGQNKN